MRDTGSITFKSSRIRKKGRQPTSQLQDTNKEHYAVERVVRYVRTTTKPHYVVHGYGYSSKDDTHEPVDHLQTHSVDANGGRKK